jgi:hypothetical protein
VQWGWYLQNSESIEKRVKTTLLEQELKQQGKLGGGKRRRTRRRRH